MATKHQPKHGSSFTTEIAPAHAAAVIRGWANSLVGKKRSEVKQILEGTPLTESDWECDGEWHPVFNYESENEMLQVYFEGDEVVSVSVLLMSD
jgi:hypothetical protein